MEDPYSQRADLAWLISFVFNILVTVVSIPYDIGLLAAGTIPHPPACYTSHLLGLLDWSPFLLTVASIFALVWSLRLHRELRHLDAQLLAWFPLAVFLLHLFFYRISPCWG